MSSVRAEPKAQDGRSVRAQRQRAATRAHIFRCAEKLFAARGYHGTSVEDIIDHAGVARGTFYLHFSSKRDVFAQQMDQLFTDLAAQVRRIEVGSTASPPVDQMRSNVLRVISLLLGQRNVTRILLREAGIDRDFDRKLEEFYGRILSRIEGGIRLGQTMGLVRLCDPHIAAACVLGSIKEILYRYAVAREKPAPPGTLAEEILGYVVAALFLPGG